MGVYSVTGEYRNFETTITDGNAGEAIVIEYLLSKGYQVIDRTDDPIFRTKDIDLHVSKDGKHWSSLEIKSDKRMAETGNIVVEAFMDRKYGRKKGWLYYCEADFLCYFDAVNSWVHMIDWKQLKKEVLDGRWKMSGFDNGTDECEGHLYIIPLLELQQLGILKSSRKIDRKKIKSNTAARKTKIRKQIKEPIATQISLFELAH